MLVGDALILVSGRRTVAVKPDVVLSRHLAEALIKWHVDSPLLQVPPLSLFALDRFKQCFEIPFTETLGAFALNDFEK